MIHHKQFDNINLYAMFLERPVDECPQTTLALTQAPYSEYQPTKDIS